MKKAFSIFLAAMLCLLMVFSALPAAYLPAAAEETGGLTLADWQYSVYEKTGTVRLTKYIGEADTVIVPAAFEAEGKTYASVLCDGAFQYNQTLKSVTMCEGVSFSQRANSLFYGCSALTHVDVSGADTSGVTSMDSMFSGCTSLETLDLSSFNMSSVISISSMFSGCQILSGLTGYENWDTSSLKDMSYTFNYFVYTAGSKVPVTVDLSRWDLSRLRTSSACFQCCGATKILLPENLAVMSGYFLNHVALYEGTSFTVPAGVKKIGYAHTLYDFGTSSLTEILVAEGNTNYKSVDGVLYSADGKELLAVPRGKRFANQVFEIPEGVEFMGELSFSRNPTFSKLILPNSFEIKYVPYQDDRYETYWDSGNINVGTNLSIAIYCYTNTTDYEVKETNPRYTSVNGIVYAKDMYRVVAIPARYNRVMDIPEGVVRWEREAMWADGSATVDSLLTYCPGVNIPSTLKAMSGDQLTMLNRLHTNRKNSSRPFTVTVAEGSENFCLDENGCLAVIQTPDQEAANAVIELIEAIGKVWYQDSYKAKIDAAQAAYDALTDAQKELVSNDQTLADAIARYYALKAKAEQAAADRAAIDAVVRLINAIGTVEYTDACKAKIDAAQAAYDALTEDQKDQLGTVQKLIDAIARYNELKAAAEQAAAEQTAADRAAADEVIQKINAIGTVEFTTVCKAKIDAAKEAYDALTEAQKALVTNAQTLSDAIARYNELKAAAEQNAADRAAADAVIQKINAIGTVEYTDACKAKIDAARNAYNALTETQKCLVANAQTLTDAIARYNTLKAAAEQAAADRAAADAVIQKISAIGTVEYTDACKAKIDAARNAYHALTETQKGLVTNARTLTDAENRYNELKAAAAAATPAGSETPQETNLCKWCGKSHTGFGGSIVGFFHNILWFFKNLFR